MGKYNLNLALVGLAVPSMMVRGPTNTTVTIPITDHPPIIQNTAVGVVASLNIWCPGTRVAPPVAQALPATEFRLDQGDHEKQMKAMAAYIYQLFSRGVGLLALQEVPSPKTEPFEHLVSELKNLDQHTQFINTDDLSKHWQKTGTESFGTSILCNQAHFNIQGLGQPCLEGRGQVHTIVPTSTGIPIEIATIHGNFAKKSETLDFMINFNAGIVVGDSNLSNKDLSAMAGIVSAEAPLLDIIDSTNKMVQAQLNTLDVFIDRVSPPSFQPSQSTIMVMAAPPAAPSTLPPILVKASDAVQILADFVALYPQFAVGGKIPGLSLSTPGGKAGGGPAHITFTDPKMHQAFQMFCTQIPAGGAKSQAFKAAFQGVAHSEKTVKNERILGIIIENGCKTLTPGNGAKIPNNPNSYFWVGTHTQWSCIIYEKDVDNFELSIQTDGSVKIRDKNKHFAEITSEEDRVNIINKVLKSLVGSELLKEAETQYDQSKPGQAGPGV